MDGTGIKLKSTGSSINVSYNADLIINDNEMLVSQLIQTNKGMSLFDTEPKTVILTRPTVDSELQCEEIPLKNAKPENKFGQYIYIWSHYRFQDDDDKEDGDGGSGSPRPPKVVAIPKPKPKLSQKQPPKRDYNNDDLMAISNMEYQGIQFLWWYKNRENHKIIYARDYEYNGERIFKGISRPNNNCYMNAILQVILNLPNFVEEIIRLGDENIKSPLYKAFKTFLENSVKTHNEFPGPLNPEGIINNFTSIKVRENRFQDAAEFFNKFIQEIMDKLKLDNTADSLGARRLLSYTFTYKYRVLQKCSKCEEIKVDYKDEDEEETHKFIISLKTVGNLDKNAILEALSDDVAICKNKCGKSITKEAVFTHLPEVLMIELNSFDVNGRINIAAEYKDRLELPLLVNENNFQTQDISYELDSVVTYIAQDRHYASFVKSAKNNQWNYFDDQVMVADDVDDRVSTIANNNDYARIVVYKRVQ